MLYRAMAMPPVAPKTASKLPATAFAAAGTKAASRGAPPPLCGAVQGQNLSVKGPRPKHLPYPKQAGRTSATLCAVFPAVSSNTPIPAPLYLCPTPGGGAPPPRCARSLRTSQGTRARAPWQTARPPPSSPRAGAAPPEHLHQRPAGQGLRNDLHCLARAGPALLTLARPKTRTVTSSGSDSCTQSNQMKHGRCNAGRSRAVLGAP